ncbi:hypothetical protein CNR22_13315 [Sphingobacteriaceae bacterium]|nr:hypothetical protein CNR22_13315 [Sphingobacteriaceae bacterium]
MMIGAVPTSVPEIILGANWLLEGDFKRKFNQLKVNKVFWVLIAVFCLHVLGLLYTSNLSAGSEDVKIKLPLFILPLFIFSAKPLTQKEFYATLYFFILGCVANTLWCLTYSFVLHNNEVIRNASRFMSHIRLGLYLNVAIACCVYFAWRSEAFLKKLLWVALVIYFVFVLYALGLASGLINFAILFLLAICFFIYRQKLWVKLAGILVVLGFITMGIYYIMDIKKSQLDVRSDKTNEPQNYAPSGRPYLHYGKGGQKENGNYIYINVQPEELQRAWKKEFAADSFHYESETNLQRYVVLVRYMASKGLNKDSVGYTKLSDADKQNIQKDIANFEYPSWSYLHKRTYELVNEYDEFLNDRFVNGHSLTMRLYFWDAALHVIKKNFVFGVGTGDVQDQLTKTYRETKSPLNEEWYKRPHNQFLTITTALGILGLGVFLLGLLYPASTLKNELPKLFWPFFLIAVLSFFIEDTLETQAGCTFYAFFSGLFLSVGWWRKLKHIET